LNPAVFAFEDKVDEMSNYLSDEISKTDKKIVAVVDFTDLQGNVTELGRFFAQEISTSIAMGGKEFEVVDRTHLNSILMEHKLAEKGIIDPETARQLGKIAGVEILVTGTITPLGDNVRLNAMVLDIETAKIIAGTKQSIPMTGTLANLSGAEIKTASSSKSRKTSEKKEKDGEIESFGFNIKAPGCEMKGNELVCPITLTNIENEKRAVSISGGGSTQGSTFHDEFGNVYRHRDVIVSLGKKPGSYVKYDFMPQIPTKVNFIIKEFNSDSSFVTASILMLQLGSKLKNSSTSIIKDIPVIK
jgi:TolB-like protein